jgi:hemerythrin-like metal-binding protein
MIKWNSKYAVGISVVDNQHKELFKLVGELSKAMKNDEELDCAYLMARLEVYSLYHFTSEEHLMQKYGYPDLEEHIREHKKFRLKILSVKDKCLSPDNIECRKMLLEYLENWLKTHTIKMDQKYVPYLKKN